MSDPAWDATTQNLRWVLVHGQPDPEGKQIMVDALTRADWHGYSEQLRIGFEKASSHDPEAIVAFNLCLHADPRRLYNLARSMLGMPEV
ncbi:hypothetical protein [Aestuariivirga sp.]|uniref:hypothetical protein n=1 Tax=Aestuariivirga sp. TaxID=2650926 RepID=UPI003918A93B